MTDLDRLAELVSRMANEANDHPLRLVEVSQALFVDQVVAPIRSLVDDNRELRTAAGGLLRHHDGLDCPVCSLTECADVAILRAALHREDGA